jgi:glycosyltransferase involved in cell wall biosynthesis
MKVLVWQWGRRGGGPRYAIELAASLDRVPGVQALLSLPEQAEMFDAARCALPISTYDGMAGFAWKLATFPFRVPALAARLRHLAPDFAICAMPGTLDLWMAAALAREGIPFAVVVHDADAHPGDGFPMQMVLQRQLLARADSLVALSAHVGDRLRQQGSVGTRPLILTSHPPRRFGPPPPPPLAHGGKLRLLSFGRLLPYKGLDLLADALARLGPRPDMEVRIVGQGPESPELDRLRALPGISVENRWVPEDEIGALVAWSDAMVLSHREASQSGAAAAAVSAGRYVVATSVGGIAEQLRAEPGAILVDPTAEAIAAGLARLLDSRPPVPVLPDLDTPWQQATARLAADLAGCFGIRFAVKDFAA